MANEACVLSAGKWIEETVRSLVDPSKPEPITVELTTMSAVSAEFVVHVPKTEVGKVIGKSGRTARSLRYLLHARSVRDGVRYVLNVNPKPKAS